MKLTKKQQAAFDKMQEAFYKMQEAMHDLIAGYKDGRLPTLEQIAECEDLQHAYAAASSRWDRVDRNTRTDLN